jgi:rod shape determining protein RodA
LPSSDHRMRRGFFSGLDYTLFGAAILLSGFGCLAIYSATRTVPHGSYFLRQIVWAALGIGIALLLTRTNYRIYLTRRKGIYIVVLASLAAVALFGQETKGAQRWLGFGPFTLQPSEFAKVLIAATLAASLILARETILDFVGLIPSALHLAIPVVLIMLQPDLGTSLVLIAMWFVMTFYAGARLRHLGLAACLLLVAFAVMWHTGMVKDYQKERLTSFLHPELRAQTQGYHIVQSKIAIGSGELWGKGLFRGPQSELRFIPARHTDFIFTVVGEEFGFVGSGLLLGVFGLVLYRGLRIMAECEEPFGQLLACGLVTMLAFQTFVNIGMTIGICPVTGIPLPFMSYGGSNLLANFIGIGILESIHLRRHKITF